MTGKFSVETMDLLVIQISLFSMKKSLTKIQLEFALEEQYEIKIYLHK